MINNRATLTTYGGPGSSFLSDEVPSYHIGDKDAREQTNFARHMIDEKLTREAQQADSLVAQEIDYNRKTLSVYFDPNQLTEEELKKTLFTNAKAEGWREAALWRHKSKHRSLTSTVNCYGNGFGEMYEPSFKIVLTTGCAPNFMGTSEEDEKVFTVGVPGTKQRLLQDFDRYFSTMRTLFTRWLQEQDKAGSKVVVTPLVGGGVFLKLLSPEHQRGAKQLINLALRSALENTIFQHIQEIVFALPDEHNPDERTANYKDAVEDFADYNNKQVALTIANVDVFTACKYASDAGKKVGLINPGSDRTIGGHYKEVLKNQEQTRHGQSNAKATVTLEELIFNLTDAAYIHAADLNDTLLSQQNGAKYYDNVEYHAEIKHSNDEEVKKSTAPYCKRSTHMMHVIFSNKEEALCFSDELKNHFDITRENKPNQAKMVDDREEGKYIIRLSDADYTKLRAHTDVHRYPWVEPLQGKVSRVDKIKETFLSIQTKLGQFILSLSSRYSPLTFSQGGENAEKRGLANKFLQHLHNEASVIFSAEDVKSMEEDETLNAIKKEYEELGRTLSTGVPKLRQ